MTKGSTIKIGTILLLIVLMMSFLSSFINFPFLIVSAATSTMGDTTLYTNSYGTGIENAIKMMNGTASGGNGWADYIMVRLWNTSSGGPWTIKAALYNASWGYVATTETKSNMRFKTTAGSYQFNFTGTRPIITNGAVYRICIWSNSSPGTLEVCGKTSDASPGAPYQGRTFTTWPTYLNNGGYTISYIKRPLGIYCSYTVNTVPALSNEYPTNASTGIGTSISTAITIADGEGNPVSITWYSNASGSWSNYGVNNSVGNGTYRQPATWITLPSKMYWFKVTVFDGIVNTSAVYHFTTGSFWIERAPTFSNPSPSNGSTDVHKGHATNITVSDLDGNATTVCFWYNLSAAPTVFIKAQQNNSVTANTTVRDINTSYAMTGGAKIYWKVTAYDGHVNVSAFYCFSTNVNITSNMVFVSKTGNDGTGDGTKGNPLLTIQHAIRYHAVNPGDIVYVRQGNYNEILYMYYNGTAGNPITISGYPGEHAVLDGTGVSIPSNYGIICLWSGVGTAGRKHLVFQSLIIENSSEWGIRTISSSHYPSNNITIAHCTINNIGDNCLSFTQVSADTYGWVADINVNNCTITNTQVSWDNLRECITFKGCKNIIFEYNTELAFHKIGIDFANNTFNVKCDHNQFNNSLAMKYTSPYDPEAAIYIDGGQSDTIPARVSRVVISNNTIWGIKAGITIGSEFNAGSVDNVTVENNVVYLSTDYEHGKVTHCLFFNYATKHQYDVTVKFNTFYKSDGTSTGTGNCLNINLNTGYIHRFVVANNIFISGGTTNYQLNANFYSTNLNLTRANNLYYHTSKASNTMFSEGSGHFEASAVRANPQFVSLNAHDFHLNRTSPAINASSSLYTVPFDYAGIPRPVYGGYDDGAFEYTGGTPIVTNVYPQNGQTGLSITPKCSLKIIDAEGDTMDVRWYEDTSGSWVLRNTNATVPNGTYRWTFTQFNTLGQTYYWSINVTDGTNYINNTYSFLTGALLSVHNPSPSDGMLNVTHSSSLSVNATVTCHNGKKAAVFIWYYDASGVFHKNTSAYRLNTSVSWTIDAGTSGYMYSWGVSATNETNITNQTFSFATAYLGPYYVDGVTGSDYNIGSLAYPFGTILFGFTMTLDGGTLYLNAGTYTVTSLSVVHGTRIYLRSSGGVARIA